MNIIQIDGYGFLIPSSPSRYRGNCSKEWGQFVGGNTNNMTCSEAEKAGLTKGKFVEMAVCHISTKILTFEPNYLNEEFLEIWGIPVGGEMKDQFHAKASELSTFLMHRQSKDKFQLLTINYNNGGIEIKNGIHWKLPSGYSFVQLDFINNFGGLKSWSYARGYIRDASGVNHNVVTAPLGCTNSGGKTVIEATTSSVATIVKNTTSTLIIPMFDSCTGANPNEISVPFLTQ